MLVVENPVIKWREKMKNNKRNNISLPLTVIFSILLIGLITTGYLFASGDKKESLLKANLDSSVNSFHPKIELRNDKNEILDEETAWIDPSLINDKNTCGECHDVDFIHKKSSHPESMARCVDCHFNGSNLSFEKAKSLSLKDNPDKVFHQFLTSPDNINCSSCHYFSDKNKYFHLPPIPKYSTGMSDSQWNKGFEQDFSFEKDFHKMEKNKNEFLAKFKQGTQYNSLESGTIYSATKISSSLLNLKGKSTAHYAFDVHAQKDLSCADCHRSANHPSKLEKIRKMPAHLKMDPRIPSTGDYLKQPNHILDKPNCSDCHDAESSHDFLPYKKRHISRLDCNACHNPVVEGMAVRRYINSPSEKNINMSGNENESTSYISADGQIVKSGENLNSKFFSKQFAFFLPVKDGKDYKWKAFNPISEKLENGKFITRFSPINHGVKDGSVALKDCHSCHSDNSILTRPVESYIDKDFKKQHLILPDEVHSKGLAFKSFADKDKSFLQISSLPEGFYLLGSRGGKAITPDDIIGLSMLVFVIIGISIHGGLRYLSHLKLKNSGHHEHHTNEDVYMYGFYERIWHWVSAGGIIILLISGLRIHFPWFLAFIPMSLAITVHNAFALIVIINAALSLFFHLASGEIKQFLPENLRGDFWHNVILQFKYYVSGIFKGEEHPIEKTRDRKLNPLQKITYFGLLNIILPLQVISGILLWSLGKWPEIFSSYFTNNLLTPIHNVISWMFLSFLIMHIYLTTTGKTPLTNLKAMITGYEEE